MNQNLRRPLFSLVVLSFLMLSLVSWEGGLSGVAVAQQAPAVAAAAAAPDEGGEGGDEGGDGWSVASLHPPITRAERDFKPRPYSYVEPEPLDLPSDENLTTTTVRGREYHIKRTPSGAYEAKRETDGATIYENAQESLYFRGTGTSGKDSNERLIVEDCTFVIDFEPGTHPGGDFKQWDTRRGAIVVEGYREVIIRNCVFVSRATKYDPIRKVTGSIVANYCLKVQIDNCYFEGQTLGWRGAILAWGCGPTEITNVEIAGAKQGSSYALGGGIWVAHGEKIAWTHKDPQQMIYPNGPLRIENVHIHDQQGHENTDGIYIQSIQPYLVRNTRVEHWKGQDSLIDIGFRDTFQSFNGEYFVNHGAVGVIENSYFGDGYVKASVGLAGGLFFRHNVMHNAWIFPYVFDGGSWYVLGNRFEDMTGVIVSGRNNQLGGWTPGEGMFIRGSKMLLFGNQYHNREGVTLPTLFVNNKQTSLLKDVIESDYNRYRLDPLPKVWAIDQAINEEYTLEEWRALGNDVHSVVGSGDLTERSGVMDLPGGLTYDMSKPAEPGLTGPVGVNNKAVLEKAKRLSEEAKRAFNAKHVEIEFEDMEVVEKTDGLSVSFNANTFWSGRGTLRIEPTAGQSITFRFSVPEAGRFKLFTRSVNAGPETPAKMLIDGEIVTERFDAAKGGTGHGVLELEAGEHTLTYGYLGEGAHRLDRFDLIAYPEAQERLDAEMAEAKRKTAARQAARDAATIKLEAEALPVADATAFVDNYPGNRASGGEYRLIMPKAMDESATFLVTPPEAGRYEVVLRLINQGDAGALQLAVNGKDIGSPSNLRGATAFPAVQLTAGEHRLTFRLVSGKPPVKIRVDRLDLVPADAASSTR